jgi:Tol biopolymer transport system component
MAYMLVSSAAKTPQAAAAGPIAQIIAPADGFKLRQGRTTAVRVQPGDHPLQGWTVRLRLPDGSESELATATQPVFDRDVAQVAAEALPAGEAYTLSLDATDTAGVTADAKVSFLIPDPQYTLIPLEPGNMSRLKSSLAALSVDDSGHVVSFGGLPAPRGSNYDILILNSATPLLRTIAVPVASSDGLGLTRDGRRFLLKALTTIDYFDLTADAIVSGPASTSFLFTTDRTGRWIAYQASDPTIPNPNGMPGGALQYFLYDDDTQTLRQLTHDPRAIVYSAEPDACPRTRGTIPLTSADGSTMVLVTGSDLGFATGQISAGCRIFAYDVANATLKYIRSLPASAALNVPVLSTNGRWLSFTSAELVPAGFRQDFGGLVDLQTGALTDPVGGIRDFPTFDAVISGDASTIVLSTTADLDPRVGNSDHNPELFAYDMLTRGFTQISDTIGGISGGPLCDSFRPVINEDGRVVLFAFFVLSTGECTVAVPQRNDSDGLELGRVRALRKRPGNRPPALAPLGDLRVLGGQRLVFQLSAPDPDGDPVVFFAQSVGGLDIPRGAVIDDHHDGTATFTWATKPEQAGLYPIRIAAFDEGGGEVFQDVTLAVCSRIVHDGDVPGVVTALFESEPPAACRDADVNRDSLVTAADVVGARVNAPLPV